MKATTLHIHSQAVDKRHKPEAIPGIEERGHIPIYVKSVPPAPQDIAHAINAYVNLTDGIYEGGDDITCVVYNKYNNSTYVYQLTLQAGKLAAHFL